MTKQQLIEQVAGVTNQSRVDVTRVYEALVDQILNALATGEKVDMRGFGIFDSKETKAHVGRNPATGQAIEIPASRRASFRAGKELKERLSGDRRETVEAE